MRRVQTVGECAQPWGRASHLTAGEAAPQVQGGGPGCASDTLNYHLKAPSRKHA